jgi:outer membrane protein TolC
MSVIHPRAVLARPFPDRLRDRLNQRARRVLALLMACVALLPVVACAAPTLATAGSIAIERDAEIARLAAERTALEATARAAGELPDPRLRLGAVNVPTDSFRLDAQDMTMLEVGFSQMLPAGDSLALARRRYEQEVAGIDARIADRRRVVVRDLRRAWVSHAYLTGAESVLEQQIAVLEPLLANATTRYGNGELRQLDVVKVGLEQAMLRERLLTLRAEQAGANAALERWLALPASELETSLPGAQEWPPLGALELRLVDHPSQAEIDRRIEAAETGERLARQRYRPEWEVDVSYGFRDGRGMDGSTRPDMLSAMLRFNLPLFTRNRQDQEVAAARAETRGLREQLDDHGRELRQALAAALDEAQRAGEIESLYSQRLLVLGEQASRTAALAYANDAADFGEVIDAARALLELHLGRLKAASMRARADVEIAYLVGDMP